MGRGSRKGSFLSHLLLLFLFAFQSCNARNNISVAQWIKDGEKITSEGNVFELGFFSPGKSSNRYVGMWYKKFFDQRAVWVANRENPLTDSSGVLKIGRDGNLVLLDGRENIIWSTNISGASNSSIALLLDIGNLVLTGSNSDDSNYLWESFNHPTDTALNEMKLGVNIVTGEKRFLTSWRSDDDPSPGNFIWGIGNNRQLPQAFIWERHNMSVPYFRSGEWRGTGFIGLPNLYNYYFNGLQYVPDDKGGIYYKISSLSGISTVILLDYSGNLKLMNCSEGNEKCTAVYQLPQSKCSLYGTCGTFGICNALKSPICSCMRGFDPKFGQEWSKGNWSGGCVRKTQLQCEKNNSMDRGPEDRFIRLKGMRLPNFANYLNTLDADECKDQCYRNCSCMAYAYVSQIGCLVWAGELIDLQQFASGAEELYVRVQLGKMKKIKAYIIVFIVLGGLVALISSILCWLKMKQKGKSKESAESTDGDKTTLIYGYSSQGILLKDNTTGTENQELLQFELSTIATATNNFFDKLGEGGFGPVYWGKLLDGQEIAVKRLSKSSGQGTDEFKNELKLISKLQHRNLVRLLGFCIEEEERMLVYEFMPNKSLDAFLFDPTKRVLLDWSKRFNIVDGIARGLLYLHRDSRLRVIHRDLKASNILLDEDMNPKISDFGMARIFGGNQTLANTNRVVGTYGYMSPEYAMEGIFSEKSDVFSFGVLLLEILSGKRNTGFNNHGQSLNLLGYVWLLWNEGKALDLMDPIIVDSYSSVELMRCIHVGLLCVQDHAVDRPTMSSIVFMLGSETTLPSPSQPVFILKKRHLQSDTLSDVSLNALTVTQVEGR